MGEDKLTLAAGDEVVVRMYGQGFGDCFLLAFPRGNVGEMPDPTNPVYVLIDSGVFYLTPQDRERMNAVARSVRDATGGVIDVLVATHEHHDHLCGFEYAKEVWQQIQVQNIWVAWTENPEHPTTKQLDHEKQALERLVLEAHKVVARQLADTQSLEPQQARRVLEPELQHMANLLGFSIGGALEGPLDTLSKLPHTVLSDLVNDPGKRFTIDPATFTRSFCEPMEVRTVPRTMVEAYVLGPPTDPELLSLTMDESEVYAEAQEEELQRDDGTLYRRARAHRVRERNALALEAARADRIGISAAVAQHAGVTENDQYTPFRRSEGIPWEEAMQDEFYRRRYFGSQLERRVDSEWLRGASQFALQLDELTNNTSLALAFRLPTDRYLLFVGDAQVGNWLSWQDIQPFEWKRSNRQQGKIPVRPTIDQLLEKTVVYKVGHHGSHNATLSTNGLEKMPDDVIAFVPVAHSYPQEEYHWVIPMPSLMRRLREKTDGQVVVPYHTDYTSTAFQERIETSSEELPAMTRIAPDHTGRPMKQYGDPVALWKQVRLAS